MTPLIGSTTDMNPTSTQCDRRQASAVPEVIEDGAKSSYNRQLCGWEGETKHSQIHASKSSHAQEPNEAKFREKQGVIMLLIEKLK